MVTIQVEVGTLTHALKLNKELANGHISLRDLKLFPVPTDGICQVNDIFSESLIAIEGKGQRHLLPISVIIVLMGSLSDVTNMQSPLTIEIQLLAFYGSCHADKSNTQQA
jgi:hypothetical protein